MTWLGGVLHLNQGRNDWLSAVGTLRQSTVPATWSQLFYARDVHQRYAFFYTFGGNSQNSNSQRGYESSSDDVAMAFYCS